MGKYIKYIREFKVFEKPEDIQDYLDSIIERNYEIIYYEENFFGDTLEFTGKFELTLVLGKLNEY